MSVVAADARGGGQPQPQPQPQSQPLPVLRDDLEIVPGAPLSNGASAWVIFDPVANRYFEIGQELLDMLTVWDAGTAERLVAAVRERFGREIEAGDVDEAIRFLISSALVRDIPDNDYRGMAEKAAGSRKSAFAKAMHSYLFFKIPLLRPDRFLQATWPVVRHLFGRTAVFLYAMAGPRRPLPRVAPVGALRDDVPVHAVMARARALRFEPRGGEVAARARPRLYERALRASRADYRHRVHGA